MVDESDNPLEAAASGHVPLGSKLYYTREKQPVLLSAMWWSPATSSRRLLPAEHAGRPAVSVSLDSRGARRC